MKKSAGVVAHLQHMNLEGLCPDAMSIGIVGGSLCYILSSGLISGLIEGDYCHESK